MHIDSLSGKTTVRDVEKLLTALKERHLDRFGEFWIGPEAGEYPTLVIGINGDQAWLNYLPTDDGSTAGFLSQGDLPNDAPDVEFITNSEHDFRPASCVIPTPLAELAAIEFFHTEKLPTCIQWIEL